MWFSVIKSCWILKESFQYDSQNVRRNDVAEVMKYEQAIMMTLSDLQRLQSHLPNNLSSTPTVRVTELFVLRLL